MPTFRPVSRRMFGAAAALVLAASATAAVRADQKIPVRSQNDLPRYTYPVTGTPSALLQSDPATFAAFAAKVDADVESTLARYDIQDRSTLSALLGEELVLDALAHRDAKARADIAALRAVQDKPDLKLIAGLTTEAVLDARAQTGQSDGPAYHAAFRADYAALVGKLPWDVVGTALKNADSGAQIVTPALVVGQVQANLDPAAAKEHAIGSDLAAALVGARYTLDVVIPLRDDLLAVLGKVIAANNVEKPDVFAGRDVSLDGTANLHPVAIGIWDSGTDVALFPGELYDDPHPAANDDPHGIAYDLYNDPTHGPLFPLTPAQQAAYPTFRQYLAGFSDLQSAVDSPAATAVRAKIASLTPAEVGPFLEQMDLYGIYAHGTHVTGIAVRGNPAARIVYGRITFDYHNVPLLPTEELVRKGIAAYQAYIAEFRRAGVRVVNMSWGGSPGEVEAALEKNGVGKTAEERKVLARRLFDLDSAGLRAAIASAPDILFVAAAGNSNQSATFSEFIPAGFQLPNLISVGAVDQGGDETAFTSYGPTVVVDANGYHVRSTVPGGGTLLLSGTSMAAPQVTNLAAKLFAIDPQLTVAEAIALIRDGATPTADGKRRLLDEQRSIALLRKQISAPH